MKSQREYIASSVSSGEHDNIDEHLMDHTADHDAPTTPLMTRCRANSYHRLPLEELLRNPARANSLVRCCLEFDTVEKDGLTYMLPHVYFDFGIVISDGGYLRSRRGFFTVIHRRLDVEKFFAPLTNPSSVLSSPLKRQRAEFEKAAKRAKFALDTKAFEVESLVHSTLSPLQTQSEVNSMIFSKYRRRRRSMDEPVMDSSPTSQSTTLS